MLRLLVKINYKGRRNKLFSHQYSTAAVTVKAVAKGFPKFLLKVITLTSGLLLVSYGVSYAALQFYVESHLAPTPPDLPYLTRRALRHAYIQDHIGFNLRKAEGHFREALSHLAQGNQHEYPVKKQLAELLVRLGEFEAAKTLFQELLETAEEADERLSLATFIAEVELRMDNHQAAKNVLESLLRSQSSASIENPSALQIQALTTFALASLDSEPTQAITLLSGTLNLFRKHYPAHKIKEKNTNDSSEWWWNFWRDLNRIPERPDLTNGWTCSDALLYYALGLANARLKTPAKDIAKEMWIKSIEIAERSPGILKCESCKSRSYIELGKLALIEEKEKEAMEHFKRAAKAATISRSLPDYKECTTRLKELQLHLTSEKFQ